MDGPQASGYTTSRRLLGLLAIPLWAACTRGIAEHAGEDDPGPIPRVETVEDLQRAILLEGCYAIARCGYAGANQRARCEIRVNALPRGSLLFPTLARDAVGVDTELGAECLRFLRESCADVLPGACRDAFVGTVSLGAQCFSSEECEGDGFCFAENRAGIGRCEERSAPGEPCEVDDECSSHGSSVAVCFAGDETVADAGAPESSRTCHARPVASDRVAGQFCGTWLDHDELRIATCNAATYCAEGVCVDNAVVGGDCLEKCEAGALCVPLPPRPGEPSPGPFNPGRCIPFVVQTDVGDPCGAVSEPFLDCDARTLACVEGRCQRKGDGSEGSVCDLGLRGIDCDSRRCEAGRCAP